MGLVPSDPDPMRRHIDDKIAYVGAGRRLWIFDEPSLHCQPHHTCDLFLTPSFLKICCSVALIAASETIQ